jgi:acyl carrier protein phosphodiesterase
MNWLAHLYLSEPNAAYRVGNLLPDLLPAGELKNLPEGFQRGMACHRRIDAFTDAHPIFRRSVARMEPPFRRYGGVIVDLFYDHFLARDWGSYSAVSLEGFAAEAYASFADCRDTIPALAYERLQGIREANLLCSYREMTGVGAALERVGRRLRRPFDLRAAIPRMEDEYDAFRGDFREFFPELVRKVGEGVGVRDGR